METLLLYYTAMILGYFLASKVRNNKEKFNKLDEIFNGLIVLLILLMGIRMGSDQKVISNLGMIGFSSVVVSVLVVGFSVLFVSLARKVMRLDKQANPISKKTEIEFSYNKFEDIEKFKPIEDSLAIEGGKYQEKSSQSNNNIFTLLIVIIPLIIGLAIGYLVILPSDIKEEHLNLVIC
ncbi:MAG: hypothetical protein JJE03_03390 [Peptostreptococcaceae bacterium]|nr:hypothetical protein [Peptostreptococcaceae bacterium]